MRRLFRGRCAWFAAAGLLLSVAAASGQQTVPPELERVRRQVRELQSHLADLETRQAGLGKERARLDAELSVAALKVREAELEVATANHAAVEAGRAAEVSQKALASSVERLRLQLSVLAILGRTGWAPLVLHALGSANDVPQRLTVALALFEEERHRRDEAATLSERRAADVATLSRRREEANGASARLAQRQRELGETRQRVAAQLVVLERERRVGAVALAGAVADQERLERLWGVVTQQETETLPQVRLLRGGLPWPVHGGRVAQGFGAQRDPRYGTVTVSHGILIDVQPGTQVGAVAPGRVSYAQFFKGYGNLVIVNHSNEIYSLYARLASMLVHPGQRVGFGDALGLVGRDEVEDVGRLYLEIRVAGRAQDPMGWLRPAER